MQDAMGGYAGRDREVGVNKLNALADLADR